MALREHDRRSLGEASTISFANLDVRPYPHQQRMLEALTVERERHDRHRNLVVAATGTGKTVVAALDYRQLLRARRTRPVAAVRRAPRARSSRSRSRRTAPCFATASFGEIHGGGRIAQGRHVFAMVQSLARGSARADRAGRLRRRRRRRVPPRGGRDATTGCSTTSSPQELLGLTATPERLDGKDVTEWFDHRIAVELRLWEAIDQGFLVPFQYFGVADGTDLQPGRVAPRRLRARGAQQRLYSNDDLRVAKLLEALQRIVLDPARCARSGSASRRSTRATWPASSPTPASTASRSPATTRPTYERRACAR